MGSKYVDSSAIMQIIGCTFNNPGLLDMTDKYTITDEDFAEQFHRIVFGSIYKLHELGAKEITLSSINDFLADRPKSEAIYNQNKGNEWLAKISINATPSSFDYYYNRLKKFSLLRAFDNCGIDVSDIYDIDNILDVKKKEFQEELLDNSTLEQIANIVDAKIDAIRMQYVDDDGIEVQQAGKGAKALVEKYKKYPEVGVPLYGSLINTVTRGARLKKFYLRSAATGVGKAIPNDTLIPTPTGWRKVGDIRSGDYLFGQNGQPTKVLKIHPQPTLKEVWRVTFSDGRMAECCKDHLWEYRYESHRGFAYRTESIETIYNRTLSLKNGLKNSDNRGYRFHIKLNDEVQYLSKELSVHPYVMGAILGDGSLRYNDANKTLIFSSQNEEIPQRIASLLGYNYTYKKSSEYNYNYTFKNYDNFKHNLWVEELFKDYPELWNLKSEDKFIPAEYLQGSVTQRYALLQGLLDTDGSIDDKGRVTFTTISSQLRDNVIELVQSLGMIANYLIDVRPDKYTTGECYKINIQCKKELKPKLFQLKRKVNIAVDYANSNKRSEYKDHLAIVNIEKTNKICDMTCFTVDNDSHLFLMNDFIVTHNTRSMIADACYIACSHIYDDNFGWIRCGTQEPVLYITVEQDLEEVQSMMLAFLAGVNEDHILNGKYEDDEEERVDRAAEILESAPLYVQEMPDYSLSDVENKIKKNIREHNVRYIFHDYIATSLKILEEITKKSGGVKLREDNILFMLSTRLKDICNQYGVFIMSATQLNGKKNQLPIKLYPIFLIGVLNFGQKKFNANGEF